MTILLNYLVKNTKSCASLMVKFNPIFSDKQTFLSALDYFLLQTIKYSRFKKKTIPNCIISVILRDLS